MNWYVVYTKPKWEKKVAERLNEAGITTYCPLIVKTTQWSDRKKNVCVPLFNSYVFVQISEKERNKIFAVSGVVRYLFWLGKPAIVKNSEIETIQLWLNSPTDFEVSLKEWKNGDRVLLESGCFKGQMAKVQEVKSNRYILILESLGCILKVEKKQVVFD